jgi:hypothetical protein
MIILPDFAAARCRGWVRIFRAKFDEPAFFRRVKNQTNKSFMVLFFKKEQASF